MSPPIGGGGGAAQVAIAGVLGAALLPSRFLVETRDVAKGETSTRDVEAFVVLVDMFGTFVLLPIALNEATGTVEAAQGRVIRKG